MYCALTNAYIYMSRTVKGLRFYPNWKTAGLMNAGKNLWFVREKELLTTHSNSNISIICFSSLSPDSQMEGHRG